MKTDRELLLDANSIIRSFNSVIDRQGKLTNWEGLKIQVSRILKEQHSFLYPTLKEIRKEKLMKLNEENHIY